MAMPETLPGVSTSGPARRPRPLWRRWWRILAAVAALAAIGGLSAAMGGGQPAPAPAQPTAAPVLSARGVVEPVAQATVATIGGGVVRSLAVRVGQTIDEGQRIAEVSSPERTEVLVAPWSGTVMGLSVNRGDTIMPGTAVATIGDMSAYQVRTTDVDEYLIGQIQQGQQVEMTVEALDGRRLLGTVDTVGLVRRASGTDAPSYPVVIRLSAPDRDLRPGMTVRIVFPPR